MTFASSACCSKRTCLPASSRDLLDPEVIEEFWRRTAKRLASENRKPDTAARRAELESEVANLTDAIVRGVLRRPPAIAKRLAGSEAELAKLRAAAVPKDRAKVEWLLPRVVDGFVAMVCGPPGWASRGRGACTRRRAADTRGTQGGRRNAAARLKRPASFLPGCAPHAVLRFETVPDMMSII